MEGSETLNALPPFLPQYLKTQLVGNSDLACVVQRDGQCNPDESRKLWEAGLTVLRLLAGLD